MAQINVASQRARIYTNEGAPAKHISTFAQIRRSVCSTLLWEDGFYEDGVDIAERIVELCRRYMVEECEGHDHLLHLAAEVRSKYKLRHVPLLIAAIVAAEKIPGGGSFRDLLPSIIRRADEMGEFLALYAKVQRDGERNVGDLKPILSKQVKLGLANTIRNFDAYQLGKYKRKDAPVSLRDVIALCHPKPKDADQSRVFKAIQEGLLESPDTWEVALSAGADKNETFTRLIKEERLGYLALLRNLRNMDKSGVDLDLIRKAILARKGAHNVLPFRYLAAARVCPQFEPELDEALIESVSGLPILNGTTIVLVDISYSMNAKLSSKSEFTRMDAAAALASIVNGTLRVFAFSNEVVEVPPRLGMAGMDAIRNAAEWGGTYLGAAIKHVNQLPHDRLIVITDEDSHDPVGDPVVDNAYMINVAHSKNGVGYGRWTHIDGFSENVLRFIAEHEATETT